MNISDFLKIYKILINWFQTNGANSATANIVVCSNPRLFVVSFPHNRLMKS